MKNFFRKIFFWENPAAGAVFAALLSLAASWITLNSVCFADTFHWLYSTHSCLHGSSWNMWATAAIAIGFQLPVTFYTFFLAVRFYWCADRSRYKLLLIFLMVLEIAIIFAGFEEYYVLAAGLYTYIFFNIILIRRGNVKWYILQTLCALFIIPVVVIVGNLGSVFDYYSSGGELMILNIPLQWRPPVLYLSVFMLAGGLFCYFKLCASAMQRKFCEVWGLHCYIVLAVMALIYLASAGAALWQQQQAQEMFAKLESNFKRPLQAAELGKLYFKDRQADKAFHDRLLAAQKKFDKLTEKEPVYNEYISSVKTENVPDSFKQLFSTPEAEKLAGFFDKAIPAHPREYVEGNLAATLMPDLSGMRNAARLLTWQGRLAAEKSDRAGVLLAWQRLNNISAYLKKDSVLISTLVMLAVDAIKLQMLEAVLPKDILTDEDLTRIQKELRRAADDIPQLDREVLYSEAIFCCDSISSMAHGTIRNNDGNLYSEGLYAYRFLLPGAWYLGYANTYELLKLFDVPQLSAIKSDIPQSPRTILAKMIASGLDSGGKRLYVRQMQYLAMIAVIDAEKIRRQTGNYPAALPDLPQDHFSGKKLLYQTGSISHVGSKLVAEKSEDEEDNSVYWHQENYLRQSSGVKVWSVGINKINEQGLNDVKVSGDKRADDISAVIAR